MQLLHFKKNKHLWVTNTSRDGKVLMMDKPSINSSTRGIMRAYHSLTRVSLNSSRTIWNSPNPAQVSIDTRKKITEEKTTNSRELNIETNMHGLSFRPGNTACGKTCLRVPEGSGDGLASAAFAFSAAPALQDAMTSPCSWISCLPLTALTWLIHTIIGR